MDLKNMVMILQDIDTLNLGEITNQTRVFLDLGIDSLTMMEIICVIENIYDIFFSEEQLSFNENLTIGELIEIINKQLKDQKGSKSYERVKI